MPKHILVVMSNAVSAEREAEYNEWYTGRHVRDVVSLPGFAAATRYVASTAQMAGPPPHKYLAIYEIDAADPADALKSLREAAPMLGRVPMSDAIDLAGISVHVYTPITERVTSKT